MPVDITPHIPAALAEARHQARACPRLRMDLEAVACLALAEAASDWIGPDGGFEAFARDEVRKAVRRERDAETRARRDGLTGRAEFKGRREPLSLAAEWEHLAVPDGRQVGKLGGTPPRKLTAGQRRRFRRNAFIAFLSRGGFSGRFLADAFDLPHSRIQKILAEMEQAI